MGINNRHRRAGKARQRLKQRRARAGRSWQRSYDSGVPAGPSATSRERIRSLLHSAVLTDDATALTAVVTALADADSELVDREAEGALLQSVGTLWQHGWQPAELVRHGRRCDGRVGRLVAWAIAADHAMRDPATLHPRWASQLVALDLPSVPAPSGWLRRFAAAEPLHREALVRAVVTGVGALMRAGPLHAIIPPPGGSSSAPPRGGPSVDDPVLSKVRALLAQAESTSFEAEAEAFTTKAQELMARHAIDSALLWASSERDERPATIRLPIDDPYADIKSLLLHVVAHRSRCHAVYDGYHGLSTVVGFASDLAAAELLFTSLLVQSQGAMRAEGARGGPGSHSRSRAFRSSFLLAFTTRIDQRLAEINTAVEQAADSEQTGGILPVLASRDDAVQGTVNELFGKLRSMSVRGGSDAAGWVRGVLAADLAKLNAGDLDERRRPAEVPMLPFDGAA